MTKKILKLAAALAVTLTGLPAQTGGVGGSPFQQAGQMGTMVPRPAGPVLVGGGRGAGGPVVVGKPVSANEERKTLQTLADGTQLESSDSNLFYRDSQGRTRVERPTLCSQAGTQSACTGPTRIQITDPVAHVSIVLDPATKTARKLTMVSAMPAVTLPGGAPQAAGSPQAGGELQAVRQPAAGTAVMRGGGRGGPAPAGYLEGLAAGRAGAAQDPPPTSEELGVETVNGVAAQGTRNTQIIPAGRIGNNRDIHVVNERWYSNDLQMLVKTVNSDPRFGVTTYQLANIVQGTQDPSLFQIPADYTVVEPGR